MAVSNKAEFRRTQTKLIRSLQNTIAGVSWDEFISIYQRLIFSICLKSGLSQSESEDVTQEAIIKAYKQIKTFSKQRGTFRNWLGVVTKSCIIDHLRKKGRRLPEYSQSPEDTENKPGLIIEDPSNSFEEMWSAESSKYLTDLALAQLKKKVKPRDFQIFHCLEFLDWSVDSVASSFDLKHNNIYQISNRMKGQFSEVLSALRKESEI